MEELYIYIYQLHIDNYYPHQISTLKLMSKIKKTNSINLKPQNGPNTSRNSPQNENTSRNSPQNEQAEQSQNQILTRRNRVPLALQETLRHEIQTSSNQKKEQKQKQLNQSLNPSKIGSYIRSKLSRTQSTLSCQICLADIKQKDKILPLCECQHKFDFCQSCLHHYVIQKVKNFEEVACPTEHCNTFINTQGLFFKQLPIDIQKSYRKINQFYETIKDPNKKLCPKQNCEGIIQVVAKGLMICNICQSKFCAHCLLSIHDGPCDQREVQFFQDNLHYRQCRNCRFIIEKDQGCNHMRCRCGYEFCYVCSAVWEPRHYGNNDQNDAAVRPVYIAPPESLQPLFDCRCCQQVFGESVGFVLKGMFKILLLFLFIVFMVLVFLTWNLLIIIGNLFITILSGLFAFPCSIETGLDPIWDSILKSLFYPIFMLIGMVVAFKQIFLQSLSNSIQDCCTFGSNCYTRIMLI